MNTNAFIDICREKLASAFHKYNIDMRTNDVQITCDIKGSCAGQAGYNTRQGIRSYFLRFNPEAITKYTDEMVDSTIAHEIAHLICYIRPSIGRNHNAGWAHVCRSLGGDGSRTHNMDLSPGKTIRRHQYNVNGQVVEVSAKRHNQIQGGIARIKLKRCGTTITSEMYVGCTSKGPAKAQAKVPAKAQAKVPAKAQAKVPAKGSKASQAQDLYIANKHLSSAQVKQLFIDVLGMTKSGASTYYYNARKAHQALS